jgi:hypothetical protein
MSVISKILIKHHLNVHLKQQPDMWRRIAVTTGVSGGLIEIKIASACWATNEVNNGPILRIAS